MRDTIDAIDCCLWVVAHSGLEARELASRSDAMCLFDSALIGKSLSEGLQNLKYWRNHCKSCSKKLFLWQVHYVIIVTKTDETKVS